ncbi:MAG TPA: response regulator [Elusimicrobiales bacterium]|nr:response regulator [Elusimicrobiales bacterium]
MKHKILIVDDEESVRRMLAQAFSGTYEVLTSSAGGDALRLIELERPALVFLDIRMPGVSGLDVLRTLKEKGSPAVVWMLTGEEDLGTVTLAMELGAAGYMTKPFELSRLREIALDVAGGRSGASGACERSGKPWHLKKK